MEKLSNGVYYATSWVIDNPKAIVVISHGMAEHAERYDDFARFLNNNNYSVYAIHHIGHGDAIKDIKGHFEKGDFDKCVDNLRSLITDIRKEIKAPLYLLGHSMGSFMAQSFIQKYPYDIDGVILSGSAKTGALHKMGSFVAHLLFAFTNQKAQNNFLDKVAFGSYNKRFEPQRTKFDWLSRDNAIVDKYIEDDLCGYVCTTGFYKAFFKGMTSLNKNVDEIRKDLPIYIFSGEEDPVGNYGEDVINLCHNYLNHGIYDVEIKLYEGGRHEMLNETNKDEVYNDVLIWLDKHVENK